MPSTPNAPITETCSKQTSATYSTTHSCENARPYSRIMPQLTLLSSNQYTLRTFRVFCFSRHCSCSVRWWFWGWFISFFRLVCSLGVLCLFVLLSSCWRVRCCIRLCLGFRFCFLLGRLVCRIVYA